MPAAACQPVRITTPQLRRLHAIGKQLGLDHEDLRDACGVTSLKQLTHGSADAEIRRLQGFVDQRHRRPRLVNSPHAPASKQQRKKIHALFRQLGWDRDRCRGWLLKRHDVAHHYDQNLTAGQATEIIKQLELALSKGPGGCVDRDNHQGTKELTADA